VNSIEGINADNKLRVLINHIDSTVNEYISKNETYDAAAVLRNIYLKTVNEVFARYHFATS